MTRLPSTLGMLLLMVASSGPALVGCGGGPAQQIRVSSAFTAEHAQYFEDGLDFVEDPSTLDGHWREDWQTELDKRVEYADLIARVSVKGVRTQWDLDRRMLQLELEIERRLHGAAPGDSMSVSVHEGDAGYPSVQAAESRMLNANYVLFVKWYEDDIGQPIPHWHLSPDTEHVTSMVRSRVALIHQAESAR